MLTQLVCENVSRKQKIYEAMDYETAVGLTWMLTAKDHNRWLIGVLFLVLVSDFD